jgi:hypothetical protein
LSAQPFHRLRISGTGTGTGTGTGAAGIQGQALTQTTCSLFDTSCFSSTTTTAWRGPRDGGCPKQPRTASCVRAAKGASQRYLRYLVAADVDPACHRLAFVETRQGARSSLSARVSGGSARLRVPDGGRVPTERKQREPNGRSCGQQRARRCARRWQHQLELWRSRCSK